MLENTANKLWLAVGSIIVGGVIIFTFQDNADGVVNNTFMGFNNNVDTVFQEPSGLIDITAEREDATYLYAKIREADEAKNETELWARFTKSNDGTLVLHSASITDASYTLGTSNMSGQLSLPDSINGMSVTSIRNSAFRDARFTGELRLPSNLVSVGLWAFQESQFSGELRIPSTLKTIDQLAFRGSMFTGTLDVSNMTRIQSNAFRDSRIDKVVRGDVPMSNNTTASNTSGIHPQSIRLANGSWYDGSNDN